MSGFRLKKINGIKFFVIDKFEKTGIVDHLFTTKIGGVSTEDFFSLNLGLNTEDLAKNIIENFNRVSYILSTTIDKMVVSNQVHETNIRIVKEEDMGKGLIKERDYDSVDGLITNIKGISLVTFYADCVPLFFLDPNKKVVGLAHAGWKGTVGRIGGRMIDKFVNEFKCDIKNIIVGIGPSIGPCCYRVNKDVIDKFNMEFISTEKFVKLLAHNQYDLDLWEANKEILREKGVKEENIIVSKICTSCNNDIFYSYRKKESKTGRMAAIIKIK
ncbi:peptidoglycan editing factor PgeF [Clostridium sp. D2Q-14]|uniref:peptidoglycan editing factor PgeF n=1 Tax=Anaeromonas gelatinilytica TaxID=2683194 RepID=UPI00193BFBC5|nr:peptidoglycan editing factor PgeF [Anaeromonas gelatinilytica]MBS4535399.1 peptidoglycan editing factor PgeF [Anaeromonas gelatinilytica]